MEGETAEPQVNGSVSFEKNDRDVHVSLETTGHSTATGSHDGLQYSEGGFQGDIHGPSLDNGQNEKTYLIDDKEMTAMEIDHGGGKFEKNDTTSELELLNSSSSEFLSRLKNLQVTESDGSGVPSSELERRESLSEEDDYNQYKNNSSHKLDNNKRDQKTDSQLIADWSQKGLGSSPDPRFSDRQINLTANNDDAFSQSPQMQYSGTLEPSVARWVDGPPSYSNNNDGNNYLPPSDFQMRSLIAHLVGDKTSSIPHPLNASAHGEYSGTDGLSGSGGSASSATDLKATHSAVLEGGLTKLVRLGGSEDPSGNRMHQDIHQNASGKPLEVNSNPLQPFNAARPGFATSRRPTAEDVRLEASLSLSSFPADNHVSKWESFGAILRDQVRNLETIRTTLVRLHRAIMMECQTAKTLGMGNRGIDTRSMSRFALSSDELLAGSWAGETARTTRSIAETSAGVSPSNSLASLIGIGGLKDPAGVDDKVGSHPHLRSSEESNISIWPTQPFWVPNPGSSLNSNNAFPPSPSPGSMSDSSNWPPSIAVDCELARLFRLNSPEGSSTNKAEGDEGNIRTLPRMPPVWTFHGQPNIGLNQPGMASGLSGSSMACPGASRISNSYGSGSNHCGKPFMSSLPTTCQSQVTSAAVIQSTGLLTPRATSAVYATQMSATTFHTDSAARKLLKQELLKRPALLGLDDYLSVEWLTCSEAEILPMSWSVNAQPPDIAEGAQTACMSHANFIGKNLDGHVNGSPNISETTLSSFESLMSKEVIAAAEIKPPGGEQSKLSSEDKKEKDNEGQDCDNATAKSPAGSLPSSANIEAGEDYVMSVIERQPEAINETGKSNSIIKQTSQQIVGAWRADIFRVACNKLEGSTPVESQRKEDVNISFLPCLCYVPQSGQNCSFAEPLQYHVQMVQSPEQHFLMLNRFIAMKDRSEQALCDGLHQLLDWCEFVIFTLRLSTTVDCGLNCLWNRPTEVPIDPKPSPASQCLPGAGQKKTRQQTRRMAPGRSSDDGSAYGSVDSVQMYSSTSTSKGGKHEWHDVSNGLVDWDGDFSKLQVFVLPHDYGRSEKFDKRGSMRFIQLSLPVGHLINPFAEWMLRSIRDHQQSSRTRSAFGDNTRPQHPPIVFKNIESWLSVVFGNGMWKAEVVVDSSASRRNSFQKSLRQVNYQRAQVEILRWLMIRCIEFKIPYFRLKGRKNEYVIAVPPIFESPFHSLLLTQSSISKLSEECSSQLPPQRINGDNNNSTERPKSLTGGHSNNVEVKTEPKQTINRLQTPEKTLTVTVKTEEVPKETAKGQLEPEINYQSTNNSEWHPVPRAPPASAQDPPAPLPIPETAPVTRASNTRNRTSTRRSSDMLGDEHLLDDGDDHDSGNKKGASRGSKRKKFRSAAQK